MARNEVRLFSVTMESAGRRALATKERMLQVVNRLIVWCVSQKEKSYVLGCSAWPAVSVDSLSLVMIQANRWKGGHIVFLADTRLSGTVDADHTAVCLRLLNSMPFAL